MQTLKTVHGNKKRLPMLNSRDAARATLESSQNCLLSAQIKNIFGFSETKMFPQQIFRVHADGETLR